MRINRSTGLGLSIGAGMALLLWTSETGAYPTYTDETGALDSYCAQCHGDFASGRYTSLADGQHWGTNLMAGHRRPLKNDCKTCHMKRGSKRTVFLNLSAGGKGLDPISCVGCHGRAADVTGVCTGLSAVLGGVEAACGAGAGLRQHHWSNGITLCGSCHPDSRPFDSNTGLGFETAGEAVLPPYYFTPDRKHRSKPSDPCNTSGFGEDFAGGSSGLDNDGDNVYDEADPDCAADR